MEKQWKACGAFEPDDSFDDYLVEMESIVKECLSEDRMILVKSVDMFMVIA